MTASRRRRVRSKSVTTRVPRLLLISLDNIELRRTNYFSPGAGALVFTQPRSLRVFRVVQSELERTDWQRPVALFKKRVGQGARGSREVVFFSQDAITKVVSLHSSPARRRPGERTANLRLGRDAVVVRVVSRSGAVVGGGALDVRSLAVRTLVVASLLEPLEAEHADPIVFPALGVNARLEVLVFLRVPVTAILALDPSVGVGVGLGGLGRRYVVQLAGHGRDKLRRADGPRLTAAAAVELMRMLMLMLVLVLVLVLVLMLMLVLIMMLVWLWATTIILKGSLAGLVPGFCFGAGFLRGGAAFACFLETGTSG